MKNKRGGFIAEIEISHLFPEWVLSRPLYEVCQDASEFWNPKIVHSIGGHEPKAFSSLYYKNCARSCVEGNGRTKEATRIQKMILSSV